MQNQPVIVFVSDDEKSEAFANATGAKSFGSSTFRHALSQVIFSHPDVVVLDARDDVKRADDALFHLRTIAHPAIIIISDMADRWDTKTTTPIIVIPEDSTDTEILETVYSAVLGNVSQVAS